MAIYRILQRSAFGPEQIEHMTTAYEHALILLQLTDREDPFTEFVARKVIEIAQRGVSDPAAISSLAIQELNAAGTQGETAS
jgi:hypothetical protein